MARFSGANFGHAETPREAELYHINLIGDVAPVNKDVPTPEFGGAG
jgi:hypothetical protein